MKSTMKRQSRWIILTAAFFCLGISMPSCPGQQAMQQQIDTLQTQLTDQNKKIQALEGRVTAMSQEVAPLKNFIEQVNSTIQSQSGALQGMTAAVTALQTKVDQMAQAAAATKPAARKPAPKKRR